MNAPNQLNPDFRVIEKYLKTGANHLFNLRE